jgi:hypothetical protein
MTQIIQRLLGFSNEDMVKYCERLKTVVTKTKEAKVGRGKTVETIQIPKYRTEQEIIDKVLNSCTYYKELQMSKSFQFRDYQEDIIDRGAKILEAKGFLYLAMEVRTGKTLTSLGIANMVGAKQLLFITKKKAISSIQADYNTLDPDYEATIINYESLHLVADLHRWDFVILDEAHSMGAFPKPSQRAISVKEILRRCNPKVILLSGTPTPESYSQMYHQVYGIPNNPFREFANFYRFCDRYVKLKERKINGLFIKDYSQGLETIVEAMKPYTINYTQKEAGFNAETTEEILEVELKPSTYKMIEKLKRDLVIEGKDEVILADTPVKLMMKVHQLFSGTVKFESGNSMVLDTTKADFIKDHFTDCKVGIFYKFKEELSALQKVFGKQLTTDLDEFNNTDKNIALQIISGREGISLRQADYLVYYNIDFSATSYWQSKDRMTTKDRLQNDVYWIFSKDGIEHDIYKAVTKKMDYTLNHFKKQTLW